MSEDIIYIERLTMCAEHRNDTITFHNVRINIVVTITLHDVRQNIVEIAKLHKGAFAIYGEILCLKTECILEMQLFMN